MAPFRGRPLRLGRPGAPYDRHPSPSITGHKRRNHSHIQIAMIEHAIELRMERDADDGEAAAART